MAPTGLFHYILAVKSGPSCLYRKPCDFMSPHLSEDQLFFLSLQAFGYTARKASVSILKFVCRVCVCERERGGGYKPAIWLWLIDVDSGLGVFTTCGCGQCYENFGSNAASIFRILNHHQQ
jgi:hypothetical protein